MQPDKSKHVISDKEVLCETYLSIFTVIHTYELIKWEYRLVQLSLAQIFFDQRFRFLRFSLRTKKINDCYWNMLHLGLSEWKFVWFDIPRKSQGHPYSAIILKRRVLKKIHLKEPTAYEMNNARYNYWLFLLPSSVSPPHTTLSNAAPKPIAWNICS